MIIDPDFVTQYNRSDSELEEFLLFAIVVAGKTARIQAKKLDDFLTSSTNLPETPFAKIRLLVLNNQLRSSLERVKLGQYGRLVRVFSAVAESSINLRSVTVEALQVLVGLKTSRFFLLHSRLGFRCAALDTHILKWLNIQGYPAPKSTPSNLQLYLKLEQIFLILCDEKGVSPADLDLTIWKKKGLGSPDDLTKHSTRHQ